MCWQVHMNIWTVILSHMSRARYSNSETLKGKDAKALAAENCSSVVTGNLRAGARKVEDRQRDLVDPAVNGTKIVLGAVAKSLDTVKRVVLTSSFAGALATAICLHRACVQGDSTTMVGLLGFAFLLKSGRWGRSCGEGQGRPGQRQPLH